MSCILFAFEMPKELFLFLPLGLPGGMIECLMIMQPLIFNLITCHLKSSSWTVCNLPEVFWQNFHYNHFLFPYALCKKSCIEEAIGITLFFTPLYKITLGIVLHTLLVAAFSIICHVKLSDICLGQTFSSMRIYIEQMCLGQTFSSMWICIEQKCLGQTFVWDRHLFGKKVFSKTFLFLHVFVCKQFYLGPYDTRIPNM